MNITPIVEALFALMLAVITTFVIPYIKSKKNSEEIALIMSWVVIAVRAAEQIYKAGHGDEKKAYVLAYLNNKGLMIDSDTLDKMIEAAVYDLKMEVSE